MLFAVIVMNATGASGNLMSLGAIDFGLIVDGAVIIVENAVRRLSEARARGGRDLRPEERADRRPGRGASRCAAPASSARRSSRSSTCRSSRCAGIEGKLFRPMARTVLFALLGAFILSLTLVPCWRATSSAAARRGHETWLMRKARRGYAPLLASRARAGRRSRSASAWCCSRCGGGAAAPGSARSSCRSSTRAICSSRRAACPGSRSRESVATDLRLRARSLRDPRGRARGRARRRARGRHRPMGIEQSDVYISLKPRAEWRRGLTKDDARRRRSRRRSKREVPEMAGGRLAADPDAHERAHRRRPLRRRRPDLRPRPRRRCRRSANASRRALRGVAGAVDVRAEQIAGLRYLRIRPDRGKLARYGLTIEDVNIVTETIAVGRQGRRGASRSERRFGLVVRTAHRLPGRASTSFRALPAQVDARVRSCRSATSPTSRFEQGPAQVSRDKQSRRLTVEFNVRGRDLDLGRGGGAGRGRRTRPASRRATASSGAGSSSTTRRRGPAWPSSSRSRSALILFLLWLAFGTVKPRAARSSSNVPFAVGGRRRRALAARHSVLRSRRASASSRSSASPCSTGSCWSRSPAAASNGARRHGEAIASAAELRLRPVLMTALVASLGFVPMALSRAPGSEVQRPLATVVIGGLVTATALDPAALSGGVCPRAPPGETRWTERCGDSDRDLKRGLERLQAPRLVRIAEWVRDDPGLAE